MKSPSYKFSSGLLVTVLILVSWGVSMCSLPSTWVVLWPACVALGTILFTRQAVLGLFAGSLSGCLLIDHGNIGAAITSLTEDHFFASMQGPWRVGAILFTLILGAFTVVIEKGGGFEVLARKLLGSENGNRQRRLEASTGVLGILCFFDGLANSLLLGRITQPLADRVGVARAKMAYIVDSTSSSIACIAFISTWIATQLSLIQQATEGYGITASAYSLFFASISQNFYCLFTLILMVIVIWRRWDIGPMKHAKACKPAASERQLPSDQPPASIWIALAPILILAISILCLFYLWDTHPLLPITGEKLSAAFSGKAGPYALTIGSMIGLLAACLLFPASSKSKLSSAVTQGAASMLSPLFILIMAWTFGSVLSELHTAQWLADQIGSSFSLAYFPAGAFRGRLATEAREVRDAAVEKLRDKYEAKIKTKEGQVDRAENSLAKEEAEASSASWDIGAKVLGGLLGKLLGGRRSSSSSTVSSARRAYKQRLDVKIAEKKIGQLEEAIAELEAELAEEIKELELEFDPTTVKLEKKSIKPYKKDIDVRTIALAWLPYDRDGEKAW